MKCSFALLLILCFVLPLVYSRASINNVHLAYNGNYTTMVVSFLTPDQTTDSIVNYGTTSGLYTFQATGNQTSYDSDAGWNHNVILYDLLPSTTYYYNCGASNYAFSTQFTFTTKGTDFVPHNVAIYGDMGTNNSDDTIKYVLDLSSSDEVDFYIHLGDISYANDHPLRYERTWNDWFEDMEPATAHKPYMVSVGNHESWCRNPICAIQTANFTTYKEKFRMPGPECGTNTNMFYSYDYYNVHYISISTESDFPGAPLDPAPEEYKELFGEPYPDEILLAQNYFQLNWIEEDLQNAVANRENVPWIFVLGHRPIYNIEEQSNGSPTGTSLDIQSWLEPLLQKYNVDIFFAGHVHAYYRTYPTYQNEPTSTEYNYPNSTVHVIAGAAGNIEGISTWDMANLPPWYAYGDDTTYGYGVLNVLNNTHLQWNYYRSDTNALEDTFTLVKNNANE